MQDNIDVTIIIVTYNSEWKKVKITLDSILSQKDVKMQIIVADDGSSENHDTKIIAHMDACGFKNYVLSNAPCNQGTVKNMVRAMEKAGGKYTKVIAPGDMLYKNCTLREWMEFMDVTGALVSFGEAVYYCVNKKDISLIPTIGSPVNKELYRDENKYSDAFVDYILANDTILGAAQMMRTEVIKEYLNLICNRIVYAEDYMIRIMMFDQIRIRYFPHTAIWYEFGTGISTGKDNKWERLLKKDFDMSNVIIGEREQYDNALCKRYLTYLHNESFHGWLRKVYKCFLFPKLVFFRLKMRLAKKYLPVECDMEILKRALEN